MRDHDNILLKTFYLKKKIFYQHFFPHITHNLVSGNVLCMKYEKILFRTTYHDAIAIRETLSYDNESKMSPFRFPFLQTSQKFHKKDEKNSEKMMKKSFK